MMQLKCTGGTAGCSAFVPQVVQCYNRGSDGTEVQVISVIQSFIHFWHAPLRVCSTKRCFRLADAQCGWSGRDAVLGQWPRGIIARLFALLHHSTYIVESIDFECVFLGSCPALGAI